MSLSPPFIGLLIRPQYNMSDAAFVFVVPFCCREFEMMRGRGVVLAS